MISLEGWPEEMLSEYLAAASKQVAMNDATWEVLQTKGVDDVTELRLDFCFYAPTEQLAQKLHEFLLQETDYDLTAPSQDSEGKW